MKITRLMAALSVLASAFALSACASTEESSTTAAASSDGEKKAQGCGTKASSDCTPHVGPKGKVRVDALVWSVGGVRVARTLGDQEFGLGSKADGRYVVVDLKVKSEKDESATITPEVVQLEVGGNTYDADTDGTVASMGDGQDPLFLEDVGPDATVKSKVVFDVPPSVLKKRLEVRFNELGFGEGHGYIALPKPAGS